MLEVTLNFNVTPVLFVKPLRGFSLASRICNCPLSESLPLVVPEPDEPDVLVEVDEPDPVLPDELEPLDVADVDPFAVADVDPVEPDEVEPLDVAEVEPVDAAEVALVEVVDVDPVEPLAVDEAELAPVFPEVDALPVGLPFPHADTAMRTNSDKPIFTENFMCPSIEIC